MKVEVIKGEISVWCGVTENTQMFNQFCGKSWSCLHCPLSRVKKWNNFLPKTFQWEYPSGCFLVLENEESI